MKGLHVRKHVTAVGRRRVRVQQLPEGAVAQRAGPRHRQRQRKRAHRGRRRRREPVEQQRVEAPLLARLDQLVQGRSRGDRARRCGCSGRSPQIGHARERCDTADRLDREAPAVRQRAEQPTVDVQVTRRTHRTSGTDASCGAGQDQAAGGIEFTGRISTMFRTLRASTPVESFWLVVNIVGIDFSLS